MRQATADALKAVLAIRQPTTYEVEDLRAGGLMSGPYRPSLWDDEYNGLVPNGHERTVAHLLFDWVLRLPTLLADGKRILVLWGPVGTGKTYAARMAGCLASVAHALHQPRFVNWPTFLALARADGGSADLRPLLRAGLLVLDDVSGERATSWALEQLYPVIESRTGPTIITMNPSPDEWLASVRRTHPAKRGEDPEMLALQVGRIVDRLGTGPGGLCPLQMSFAARKGRSYRR